MATLPTQLADAMDVIGLEDTDVFERWRDEERTYLERVNEVPEEDRLRTEYVRQLKRLDKAK